MGGALSFTKHNQKTLNNGLAFVLRFSWLALTVLLSLKCPHFFSYFIFFSDKNLSGFLISFFEIQLQYIWLNESNFDCMSIVCLINPSSNRWKCLQLPFPRIKTSKWSTSLAICFESGFRQRTFGLKDFDILLITQKF